MALGVIFVSLTPGYNVELMNFLFGNILWVSQTDLTLLITLAIFVVLITLLLHRKFQAVCFDETEAELRGISVKRYYLILLNLVAISVVILIQIVGAILVIAMLAIPAAVASRFSRKLSRMMVLAVIFGALFTAVGLIISFYLNWPPGATIALVAAVAYSGHLMS
jgi:zinc transport system permease protein